MKLNINGEIKIELPQIEYNSNLKFVLFGIGEVGRKIYKKLSEKVEQSAICYIIDSAYPDNMYNDTPIIRPSDLDTIEMNEFYYILGTLTNTNAMEKILMSAGVSRDKILTCTDIFSEEKMIGAINNVKKICIYPIINDIDILINHIEKINWFLSPEKTGIQIYFVSNLGVKFEEKQIKIISEKEVEDIEFDITLIWNYYEYSTKNSITTKEVYCIDDSYFSIIDLRMLTSLRYRLTEKKEKDMEQEYSIRNFKKYIGKFHRAYIIGLGGSIEQGGNSYSLIKKKNNLKIVCNTAVYSEKIINTINPNLYVLSDEVFLTKKYENVLNKIIDEIASKEYLLVVPKKWISILRERYNSSLLKEKIVGIEIEAEEICFPTEENLKVFKKAGNIVTRLAIPLASAFCDEIYFIGCDGKPLNQSDGEMWSYSESLKKETKKVFDESFKKTVLGDILDDDYYLVRHYEYMKELIEFGEKLGKKYVSLTESYIPVLKERQM